MLANKFLGSIDTQLYMTERAARANRLKELGVEPETGIDEQDESRKVLANAQLKETRKHHDRKLNALRNLSKTREIELLQKRDE